MIQPRSPRAVSRWAALTALCWITWPAFGWAANLAPMPEIQPAELAALLATKGTAPVIFQVGFRVLYAQAHIPGAHYVGPASETSALDELHHDEVQPLPKSTPIILYCGCCPWDRCPNLRPAYQALQELHFASVRALHIDKNFGVDWVDKGYPVERGPR